MTITRAQLSAQVAAFNQNVGPFVRAALLMSGDRIINTARSTRLFDDRTGRLRSSILRGPITETRDGPSLELAAGSNLTYAAPVHDGSKPHQIRPRRRKALRFVSGGSFVFRRVVNHPGTQPRPFLTEAIEANLAETERTLAEAVELAFVQAGFERAA